MKKAETANITLTPLLQRLFVVMLVLAFVAQTSELLYWVLRQFPSNHNLSSFLALSITTLALPLLFFTASYFFVPRKPRLMMVLSACCWWSSGSRCSAWLIS